jgi:hypothetical protein
MSELANMLALQAQIGLAPVKHAVARVALRLVSNLPTNYFANERYTQRDHTHTHSLSLSLSVSRTLSLCTQCINQLINGSGVYQR